VLFDVDGTLYDQSRLRARILLALARAAVQGHSVRDAVRLARVLRAYRRAHESLRGTTAAGGALARLQIARAAAASGTSEREVADAVEEWMIRRPLEYLPRCRRDGLLPLLSWLRQRGVALGVLSDYPSADKLHALGVAGFFSQVLCTTDAEIDALKPDPRGFRRACERWRLPPGEVLYVGDREDVDARGARAAGLRCALLGRHWRVGAGGEAGIPIRRIDDVRALVARA
jgi:phosphoglycolate phosphatase/putative hydrolase of the HAD superfamily